MSPLMNILIFLLSFPLLTLQYALFFDPLARITKFQSTLTVPPPSPHPNAQNAQGVWAGLQPENARIVLQTVVQNTAGLGPAAGTWYLEPQVCCGPQTKFDSNQIWQSDLVAATYDIIPSNGHYRVNWHSTPSNNNPLRRTIEKTIEFSTEVRSTQPLTIALLAIEIQGQAGSWDFGPVTWTNIVVTAEKMDTNWCNTNVVSGGFRVVAEGARHSVGSWVGKGSATCRWGKIVMVRL